MTLGDRLRILRAARGLSQVAVAERAGVQSSTVSYIEAGKGQQPRPYNVEKIAAALEVPVDALLFDVVCARELLKIMGVSPRDVAGDPVPQGRLERTALELAEQLGPERVESAIQALRGILGVLSPKGLPPEREPGGSK